MSNSSDDIMVLALYLNCSIWPLTCCSTTRPFSANDSCQRSISWILGVWPHCWEDRHNADMHNGGKYCNFPDDYHVALLKHREPIFFILKESTCRRCSSPADPLSLQKGLEHSTVTNVPNVLTQGLALSTSLSHAFRFCYSRSKVEQYWNIAKAT